MEPPADAHSPLGYIRIPDLLENWPWPRRINPLYAEVTAEGNEWLRSFSPFSQKSQHAFERCMFGLCAALVVPDAPRGMSMYGYSTKVIG